MNRHENLHRTNIRKKPHLNSLTLHPPKTQNGKKERRGRGNHTLLTVVTVPSTTSPLKGLKYDSLILDSKFSESNAWYNFPRSNIDFLMIEDTDYISVLSRTCSFDIGEEFMFEIGTHIWTEERWMEG